jgi:putative oxidoreductase
MPIDRTRWALLPLRLLVGFGFAAHGLAKLSRGPDQFAVILGALGVPAPHFAAWATVLIECFGGVGVMVGAFVPLLAVPLAAIMLTAILTVHLPYGYSSIRLNGVTPAGAEFGPIGIELPLLYVGALIALALSGPTIVSVDRWRAGRRERARRADAPASARSDR